MELPPHNYILFSNHYTYTEIYKICENNTWSENATKFKVNKLNFPYHLHIFYLSINISHCVASVFLPICVLFVFVVQLSCTFKMMKMADFMICFLQDKTDGIRLSPVHSWGCGQMIENWWSLSSTEKTLSVVYALGSVSHWVQANLLCNSSEIFFWISRCKSTLLSSRVQDNALGLSGLNFTGSLVCSSWENVNIFILISFSFLKEQNSPFPGDSNWWQASWWMTFSPIGTVPGSMLPSLTEAGYSLAWLLKATRDAPGVSCCSNSTHHSKSNWTK